MFDRYVMVDWSAANRPKSGRDSIWICTLDECAEAVTVNPPTRAAAESVLRSILHDVVEAGKRALVGFDFPHGYPAGLADALQLGDPAWLAVWAYLLHQVQDGPDNLSNRFDVAAEINRRLAGHVFWGCPPAHASSHLSPRRDRARYRIEPAKTGLGEWRKVESLLRYRGRQPHSVWKLVGAGSVGSQSLTGIPVVARLRNEAVLRSVSKVWPFEVVIPELADERPCVVHAEVWPSLIGGPPVKGQCKDETQVIGLGRTFRALDRDGRLQELFAAGDSPSAPEEGWILGVVP